MAHVIMPDGTCRPAGRRGIALPLPTVPVCRHRGEPTGERVPCRECGGRVQLQVVACAEHGRCVTTATANGLWSCQHCGEVEAPVAASGWEPWPGWSDPYPDAPLDPIPAGWTNRAVVRRRHQAALEAVVSEVLPPPTVALEAGICYVGGGRYWPGLVVAVRMCREYTTLPVRVYHRGPDDPVRADDLVGLPGVTVHDLDALGPRRRGGAWESKALAIRDCPWRQVIYLDADAYLVADPAPLLSAGDDHDALTYWQDLPNHDHHTQISAAVRPPCPAPACVQGGQLVINRVAGWRLLNVACWLNQHSDYYYTLGYGDQAMWQIALAATCAPYRSLGRAELVEGSFVGRLAGEPIVVHRCNAKWWGRPDDPRCDALPAEETAWALRTSTSAPARPVTARTASSSCSAPTARCASAVFAEVYRTGRWGRPGSSGDGSSEREAAPYLTLIWALAQVGGWTTCADLGAGDGRVTRALSLAARYAIDCVAGLEGPQALTEPGLEVVQLDIDRDRDRLPCASVALLKDVLHHWPSALIRDWLGWARTCRKWRAIVLTFDHPNAVAGADCELGGYRPLSPALPPLADLGLVPVCTYLHKTVCLAPVCP